MTYIILSENVTSIGSMAFDECTGLTSIVIPASVIDIGFSAFSELNDVVILTPKGSYAEEYARESNVKFITTEDTDF